MSLAADGRLSAVGSLYGSGDIASWNGSAWELWDASVAGATTIAVGTSDPVVVTDYDIWFGGNSPLIGYEIAGTATVTNSGIEPCYPVFQVTRSGGTSATLYTLINETTGKRLMFDYSLRDGETLVVDCRPDKQSITSYKANSTFNWSKADMATGGGSVATIKSMPSAMIPGSDFGTFTLQPGGNQITCFVDVAGAPTVTATLEWKESFRGAD